jgi:ribosomal protein L11 methyltransferase
MLTKKKGSDSYSFMKRWLAVSLLIPRGYREAISNFLFEQGASGIEELDEDVTWERLKTYFLQDGSEKRSLRALHRYLKSLQGIDPNIAFTRVETASISEENWGENWKKFFKPVQVTQKVVVKPPWSQVRLKKAQLLIEITPGMAFGTGTHATTKLCIQALEVSLRKKGLSVLDVGTGSGILSIIAARLGAKEVLGLDIDGVAIENARENVKKNGVSDIVTIRKRRIGDIQKRFDLIVANIDHRSLRRLRMPLLRHLKYKGFLILSGILEGEGERFRQYYLETELLQLVKMIQEGEWICLIFRKKERTLTGAIGIQRSSDG